MKSVLFGNLTIDENELKTGKYQGPGGSVYYLAKTFENLGVPSTVVSPYGPDFPRECLSKTTFVPDIPLFKKTLKFKNRYFDGKRRQSVENYKDYLHFNLARAALTRHRLAELAENKTDMVFIAPIIDNMSLDVIKKIRKLFPKSFFSLLPQGIFRKIDKLGNVCEIKNELSYDLLRNFNFICLSEEDLEESHREGRSWSRVGPLVCVTQAQKGSSLYKEGQRFDTSAFEIDQVTDPTGAGDIFAASFCFYYLKNKRLKEALVFANASAGLSLRYEKNELQYGYKDIINFIRTL